MSAAVVVALASVGAAPAVGANKDVQVTDNVFTPARVAVRPGDTVTWINPGSSEPHSVHFDDNSFALPEPPSGGPWTVGRPLPAAGRYLYHCDIHGRPGGQGMAGLVDVNAAGVVAPTAILDLPSSIARVGETVSFSATRSTAGGRPIGRYEWDLDGDGTFETDTGTTPTASRAYASPATLAIRLRLTDAGGDGGPVQSQVATSPLRVTAPPTAAFSASPSPARTGQAVTFNGSFSTDSDGSVARYEWDLDGDGSFETDTGARPSTSRAYITPARVTVGLRVTDNDGVSATTTRLLQVNAAPPPPAPAPVQPATPATAKMSCSSLRGAKRTACEQRKCRSLKGTRRATCVRKSCRFLPRSKRKACMRKSCRWLKRTKSRACLRKYAARRR